jgi:hypothetical protein
MQGICTFFLIPTTFAQNATQIAPCYPKKIQHGEHLASFANMCKSAQTTTR